jgi:hypothetical protein
VATEHAETTKPARRTSEGFVGASTGDTAGAFPSVRRRSVYLLSETADANRLFRMFPPATSDPRHCGASMRQCSLTPTHAHPHQASRKAKVIAL